MLGATNCLDLLQLRKRSSLMIWTAQGDLAVRAGQTVLPQGSFLAMLWPTPFPASYFPPVCEPRFQLLLLVLELELGKCFLY